MMSIQKYKNRLYSAVCTRIRTTGKQNQIYSPVALVDQESASPHASYELKTF